MVVGTSTQAMARIDLPSDSAPLSPSTVRAQLVYTPYTRNDAHVDGRTYLHCGRYVQWSTYDDGLASQRHGSPASTEE